MSQSDGATDPLLPKPTTVIDIPSEISEHPPAKVYIRHPYITYTQFLFFFFLFLMIPLVFSIVLYSKGAITAPYAIASFSHSNPRLTPQLITVVGSILTICVKWGFAGALTTYARKHLQTSRPVHNIELLSALKNGALTWSWTRRPIAMSGTFVATVLCGLLTSGFVALITPFPVATTTTIDGGVLAEFDFSSSDPSCHSWSNGTSTDTVAGSMCASLIRYANTSIVFNDCSYRDPYGDDMTSAKSAMAYRFAPDLSSQQLPNLVQSLPQFSNMRLIGGTAGTLPLGPAGVEAFPNSTLPYRPTPVSSFNYTLELQGNWAEVSCSYTTNNASRLSILPPGQRRNVTLICDNGDTPKLWDDAVFIHSFAGMIIAGLCYNNHSDAFTFHLRSLWHPGDDGSSLESELGVYAGIGAVECSFSPRFGLVSATYQTDLAAFNMTRPAAYAPFSMMNPLTKSIVTDGMVAMLAILAGSRTEWSGNVFGGAIYYVARLYGNVTAQQRDPLILDILADGLKGLYEFHMTKRRFRLAAFNGPPPNQTCFRPVTGEMIEKRIGWNYTRGVALGLIPLVTICLFSITLILWTINQGGDLTLFDPTDPVSLIAAASDGKLRFVQKEEQASPFGDPDDEFVKNRNVRYGEHKRGWGLKAD